MTRTFTLSAVALGALLCTNAAFAATTATPPKS